MKFKTIKTVINHPLNKNRKLGSFFSLIKRALIVRLHKYPIVYPFIENTFLVVEKGMSSAELQIYCTLYDYDEMLLMLHFLRDGDNFADVGGNIGVYSVLASGISQAQSFCFEPIPSTFNRLKRNIEYNNLSNKVQLFNNGVGEKHENLFFTNYLDAVNHVVDAQTKDSLNVEVNTLDYFLNGAAIQFLKVDVEGFEAHVLNGATETLKNNSLCIVLIETNGLTNQYNYTNNFIHEKLIEFGFEAYSYFPKKRELIKADSQNSTNTIYCRNIDLINQKIKSANKIKVANTYY